MSKRNNNNNAVSNDVNSNDVNDSSNVDISVKTTWQSVLTTALPGRSPDAIALGLSLSRQQILSDDELASMHIMRTASGGYERHVARLLRIARQLYALARQCGVSSPPLGAICLATGISPSTVCKWMSDALVAHKKAHPSGPHPLAIPRDRWDSSIIYVTPRGTARGDDPSPLGDGVPELDF